MQLHHVCVVQLLEHSNLTHHACINVDIVIVMNQIKGGALNQDQLLEHSNLTHHACINFDIVVVMNQLEGGTLN